MRKKSLSTALLALLTASAYAQGGDGIAGITEATSMVTSYFYPLVQLIYAIGAVTGLIGGIRVYQKFSQAATLCAEKKALPRCGQHGMQHCRTRTGAAPHGMAAGSDRELHGTKGRFLSKQRRKEKRCDPLAAALA